MTTQEINAMVLANMGLVYRMVDRYDLTAGFDREDLVHEGVLALIDVIPRFDPEKGKFSTIASFYIRLYLQTYAGRFNNAVGLTPGPARKVWENRPGISERIKERMKGCISIQEPRTEDGATLEGMLEHDGDSPEEILLAKESRERAGKVIEMALGRVTSKEAVILRDRLCADGDVPTLQDLGKVLGITRERVRQIEERVKVKVEKYGRMEGIGR